MCAELFSEFQSSKWCSFHFQSKDCLPEVTRYNITINSNGEATTEVVLPLPTNVISIPLGQDGTVTVTPSNVLGFGSPTSTTFGKFDHMI